MTTPTITEITAQSFVFETTDPGKDARLLICSTEGDMYRLTIAARDVAPVAQRLVGGAS